jgi:Rhs element Vgr protein
MSERVIATEQSQDLVTSTILIDGNQIPGTVKVNQIVIDKEVNRIPTAKIVLIDGDPSAEDFPVSNEELFVPGKQIQVQVGYHSDETTLFDGIIVKHSIKLRANGNAVLILECKDKAFKMSIGRKSKYFYEVKDSEVMEEIVGNYSLTAEVADTQNQHQELVQFQVTDWDFLMIRTEINGMLCFVDDGKISIKKPDLSADPITDLVYGATIVDLDAEIDARWQQNGVNSIAWDAANQEALDMESVDPSMSLNGNIAPGTLAEVGSPESWELPHGGQVKDHELQSWADAYWMRVQLGKVRGKVKFTGIPDIKPGVLVNLQGVGERFNGKAYITGVRHTITEGDWKSNAQFGLDPAWFSEKYPVHQQPASGIIPGISGLQIGLVTQLGEDPEGEGRILVRLPVIDAAEQGVWARVAAPDAGTDRTVYFRPEIGDEVIVGFLHDDPRFPIVLGALHSSDKPSPIETNDDNHEKGIITRSNIKLIFNDDTKTLTIETPGERKIMIDDDGGTITLEDADGNKCVMDSAGIVLESSGDISVKASGDLNLEGANVNIKASAQLKGEGGSGAEISSSGTAVLKGSLVQIN